MIRDLSSSRVRNSRGTAEYLKARKIMSKLLFLLRLAKKGLDCVIVIINIVIVQRSNSTTCTPPIVEY